MFWGLGWKGLISKPRFKMHNVCVSAPVLSGESPEVRSQAASHFKGTCCIFLRIRKRKVFS